MNGLRVSLSALADTGALSYLFLNRSLSVRLSRATGSKILPLPAPIPIRGFQNTIRAQATHYMRFHLTIDGRRIYNCPWVILDLGERDAIIGVKWMRRFRLKLNPKENRFVWPSYYPPSPRFAKEIVIRLPPSKGLRIRSDHQADVNRREREMAMDKARQINGRQSCVNLVVPARREIPIAITRPAPLPLTKPDPGIPPNTNRPRSDPVRKCPKAAVPICEISANAFHYNMKRKETEFFQTSIYKVDRILKERYEPENPDVEKLINDRLPKQYRSLRQAFSKRDADTLPPHRYYNHKIQLEGPLPDAYSPLYRQSTKELKVIKEYLLKNLDKGFIETSTSPFASPVLFVKKADGSLRFCIDYRKLNALTRKDAYPIPRIDELLGRVSKAKIFTKLDIRAAFNRIRIDPESKEYTTFRTRYGSYKCKVLPFGLYNGPSTYQRYMNDVLLDYLDDFCIAYLDDILIYSENVEEHQGHVEKVLKRLLDAGLQADIKKCEFHVTRTRYLGYVLTTTGIEPDPEKVEPLRNWKYPKTVTGVKSYLGFCGFYRQFIRNFGLIAKPLSVLTRPTVPWNWTEECRIAFEELRKQLLSIQRIYHFDPDLPTKLETDASDGVVAGVLSQQHSDKQ
ncbi:hypothetical protein PZA11_005918 [Diplocarpon coronariae]